jgi:hypothetical protein
MFDREDVLHKAFMDCIKEMYAKAQPAADFENILQEKKDGKIDEEKDGPIYNRHYLSMDEFIYIMNKYMEAYRILSEWKDDVSVVEEYLEKGGSKDKYIEKYTDENGDFHPGYRGYEKVAPIKEQIFKYICESQGEYIAEELTDKITEIVMNTINECKNFYTFNRDEMKFRNTLAMWATPTSNKETVKKWWKDHYDVDIEIEDRNPLLFWDYDYYGDNIDEVMKEEYGDNWEEYWWNEYEKDQAKKKAEQERKLKEWQEKYGENKDNKGDTSE